MIEMHRILDQLDGMTLEQVNDFMSELKQSVEAIQKNTFAARLKAYFQENPKVEFVVLRSFSNTSSAGMQFDVSTGIYSEDDEDDVDELIEGIDTEIFGIYEGMEENLKIHYLKNFNGFDDYTVTENDEEEF